MKGWVGIKVSVNIVKKLLKKHGFVKRKALISTGEHKRLAVQEDSKIESKIQE